MDENEKVVEWQDSVNIYLNEISKYPLLSEEEEKELLLSAKEGNEKARNKLVKHNLRLVVSIVNNYYTDKNDYLDLIQAGSLGLFSAIDRFDCSQNVKLATYATPCIKKYISKEIVEKSGLSEHHCRQQISIKKAEEFFAKEYHRASQNDEELAEYWKNNEKKIGKKAIGVRAIKSTKELLKNGQLSLDEKIGDGKNELVDMIADNGSDNIEKIFFAEKNDFALSKITPIERLVLNRIFSAVKDNEEYSKREIKKSFAVVGKELGFSKERVEKIYFSAEERLIRLSVLQEDK